MMTQQQLEYEGGVSDAEPPIPALFVKYGRTLRQVTPSQASEMFSRIRDKIGAKSSEIGPLKLYNADGKEVGHVSYNGNVWLGEGFENELIHNATGLVKNEKGRWDIPKDWSTRPVEVRKSVVLAQPADGVELVLKAERAPANISKWPEPTKPNHEIVFKPYGQQGAGFYQKPMSETGVRDKAQSASAAKPAAAKEPWQMTQDEWNNATRFYRSGKTKNAQTPSGERVILVNEATPKTFKEVSASFFKRVRRNDVAKAISEGKPVPQEVLNDYPELTKPNETQETKEIKTTCSADAAKPDDSGAAKMVSSPESVNQGDTIRWEPNNTPEARYYSPVEGIATEVIHNQFGEIGFHILAPLAGDPGRVVRVWASRGNVEIKAKGVIA